MATSLHYQATSFVGRAAELDQIDQLLAESSCRLLTLLGPGGIGKTRLAVEVATRQFGAFADGVALVPLAAITAPNQIVSAIGDVLKLSFGGQPDPAAYLIEHLHERHMLLVLDNFEHVLDGAELVANIVAHAPHVTIMITSRERLRLQAEWLFEVAGLTYPAIDQDVAAREIGGSDLVHYGAVQLFVQRAQQIQSGFRLSEETRIAVMRICQQVAGMPLAIELAAAGMHMLPIAEIERQIRSNLDILATTQRDVPARHRSMRAVFDHSWRLLSEPEQTLLSHLAVFRGGCTAAAATQVAGATLAALTALIDKSLVRQSRAEPRPTTDRSAPLVALELHFILLEPIREYALEQLVARGEAATLQRVHAEYYLALANAAAEEWDTATADTAIARLDREQDNLRAALQWARDGGDSTLGFQLAGALRTFWQNRGYHSEGRIWLEQLLALDDPSPDPTTMTARLRATHTAAWLASDQHDYVRATQLFEQSMALRHALGQTEGATQLLAPTARAARAAGHYARALALLEDRVAQYRAEGNRASLSAGGLGLALYELGLVLRERGEFSRAAALFEESIAFHGALGNRADIAVGWLGLSDIARDQGDATKIRMYSDKSLAIFRELGVQWAIGFALNNLALADFVEGNLSDAAERAKESLTLFRTLQADASCAEVLITLGKVMLAQGDRAAAYQALTESLRLALALGPRLVVTFTLEGLADVMVAQNQCQLAIRLLSTASALRTQMGTPVRPVDQAAIEHAHVVSRATLGDTAFASLWEEAQVLPLEQILSTVLGAATLVKLRD